MSRFALRLRDVRKRYGKTVALDGLTLDVPRGALVGLVGPNGAGKTTAFGIATGAVRADGGEIDVLGEGPFDPRRHAGRVTVLPQDCALPPHSSARQLLVHYARLAGASAAAAEKDAARVLDVVRLSDRASARVSQLSHGMKRRLAVAQALLGEPELVLLDEPTGGLDPHLVVEMRDVLKSQRGARTLVVSSHILADLEAICDRVAFIEAGACVTEGAVDELTRRGRLVRVRLAAPIDLALLDADREPRLDGDVLAFRMRADETADAANADVLPKLIDAGARVLEVRLGESLEDAYMATRVPRG